MASKVRLYQLGEDVIDFILQNAGTGEGGKPLTWDIISNVAVGAAPAGTVFRQGEDLTTLASKILVQDITPSISTTFSNAGTRKKGEVVDGTKITIKITNLKDVTVPIAAINFYKDDTKIQSGPFVPGEDTYTFDYLGTIDTDTIFKAEVIYGNDSKVFGTGIFTFTNDQ